MAHTRTSCTAVCVILLSLALGPGLAQEPQQVGGPVLGYLVDNASLIRPVLGVPGAATLGPPVLSSAGLESIVFSPQRAFALALTEGQRRLVLLRNLSGAPTSRELEIAPGATRIALSQSGDAAALYYAGRLEVVTGLPDAPSVSWGLDLPAGLAALAVNDGGSAVLTAIAGEVLLLAPGAGQRSLYPVAGPASLAFLGNADAVVADGALSQVFLVRDVKGQPQITPIGGPAQGVSRPIAVTAVNGRVFVANADPGGVVALSLDGGEPVTTTCGCTPTGLEPLDGASSFRLTEPGQGPVWVLDAQSSPPRILFVPDPARTRRATSPPRPVPVRRGGDL